MTGHGTALDEALVLPDEPTHVASARHVDCHQTHMTQDGGRVRDAEEPDIACRGSIDEQVADGVSVPLEGRIERIGCARCPEGSQPEPAFQYPSFASASPLPLVSKSRSASSS